MLYPTHFRQKRFLIFMNSSLVFVLGVIALEILFQSTFARLYFQIGIPVFRRTIKCRFGGNPIPGADELGWSLPDSRFQEICFKALDASSFGFRERFFSGTSLLTYTPLMHGLLSFDRRQGVVSVTGHANWTLLLIVLFFIKGITKDDALFNAIFAIGLFAILSVIYFIQTRRFSDVLDVAVDHVSSRS